MLLLDLCNTGEVSSQNFWGHDSFASHFEGSLAAHLDLGIPLHERLVVVMSRPTIFTW